MPDDTWKQRGSREKTRRQLLHAAEQLFAEAGIDAVSLRQINVAAGQKNSSAVHYHFGSKAALILAIYEERMASVNTRREQMLDDIEQAGKQHEMRALLEAILYPIVDEIAADASGPSYIRFLAQAMGHPQLDMTKLQHMKDANGLARIIKHLRKALPDMPDKLLSQRFGLSFEQIIHSLADRQKLGKKSSDFSSADATIFTSNLVDFLAGAMTAPISASTQEELQRANRDAG